MVNYYSLNDSKWVLDLFKKADIRTVPQIWDIEGNYIGGYQELKEQVEGV
ncbi:glutaredoxin [Roseobacter phage CRP-603]|nr:glutaredoxin [Roseobacter phage CRP-603]